MQVAEHERGALWCIAMRRRRIDCEDAQARAVDWPANNRSTNDNLFLPSADRSVKTFYDCTAEKEINKENFL
jgi:hypothetical protein